VPVSEVAQCRIELQAPVVTWENTLGDTPSPLFSFNHYNPWANPIRMAEQFRW